MSESSYLFGAGVFFIMISLLILVVKKEKPYDSGDENIFILVKSTYSELLNYACQPHVKKISLIIITQKFCFAASDSLIAPKMVEFGMKREDIAILSIPSIIIQIIASMALNYAFRGRDPVKLSLYAFPLKMGLQVLSMGYIHLIQKYKDNRTVFMTSSLIFNSVHSMVNLCYSIPLTNFFSLIIDPHFAGSQLTFLNTVQNLAYKWPNTLVLYLVDGFTITSCNTTRKSVQDSSCPVLVDGYHIVAIICTVSGYFWYNTFKRHFLLIGKHAIERIDKSLDIKSD